jgi:hypothetical protein
MEEFFQRMAVGRTRLISPVPYRDDDVQSQRFGSAFSQENLGLTIIMFIM